MKGFMYYVAFLLYTVFCSNLVDAANHWSYENQDNWSEKCTKGKKQSPINLQKDTAEHHSFTEFQFKKYDVKYDASVKNTGHSVAVTLNYPHPGPSVKGGGLPFEYVLDHLHFHWESEHTLHSNHLPLELHFVHYAKIYNSTKSALKHNDNGLAVLGVLFDLSDQDNPAFEPILSKLYDIKDVISREVDLDRESLIPADFLPKNIDSFFRYEGSLTTPDCDESVLWTVFYQTSYISKRQYADFHTISAHDGPLTQNFRSEQKLNNRVVIFTNTGSIIKFKFPVLLWLLLVLLVFILC